MLLVQNVKTHGKSTFLMLHRLSVLKTAVQLHAADHEIPVPTPNEWQLIDKVLRLLQPFFEITKKVSGEQSLLSSVIPDVAALNRYLKKCNVKATGIYTLKDELRNALKKRFLVPQHEDKLNIMLDKPYVLSTLLDPRFKGRYMQHESFAEGKTLLLEEVKRVAEEQIEQESEGDGRVSLENEPPAKKKKGDSLQEDIHIDFSFCYDELFDEQEDSPVIEEGEAGAQRNTVPFSVLAAELEGYMNIPNIERNENRVFGGSSTSLHSLAYRNWLNNIY